MKIFFFPFGEPSGGDLHGANLIRALSGDTAIGSSSATAVRALRRCGCRLHADLTQLAVMWIARVGEPSQVHRPADSSRSLLSTAERPDAVVMIDYPGFNWWIARRAKARGIRRILLRHAAGLGRGQSASRSRSMASSTTSSANCRSRSSGSANAVATAPRMSAIRTLMSVCTRTLDQEFVAKLAASNQPLVTILPGSRTAGS